MKRYLVQHAPKSTLDWSKAVPLTDFTFAWEQRPAPWTEFRALHDGERFWFRFECEDAVCHGNGGGLADEVEL